VKMRPFGSPDKEQAARVKTPLPVPCHLGTCFKSMTY
jgi:hypothetical protein